MKFTKQEMRSNSLIKDYLTILVPKDNSTRKKLDKINWKEVVEITKKAYIHTYYKEESPNPRIMAGLFIYSCINDKKYRECEEDFSFNLICQYACGFKEMKYRTINHTSLIKFEQRLGEENIEKLKNLIEKKAIKNQPPKSKGNFVSDTTVTESNITFPTDMKVMEQARKFLVQTIKENQTEVKQEHRHQNRLAKKNYLDFSKNRKKRQEEGYLKEMKEKSLKFLKRNLTQAEKVIQSLNKKAKKENLNKKSQKTLEKINNKFKTAQTIYEQQKILLTEKRVPDRIVSLYRPEIRPIFRGKQKRATEFGPKVEFLLQGKALILGKISYKNFNDGHGVKETIIRITEKLKYKVKELIGDKGYQGISRWLKTRNIIDGIEKRGKREIPKKIPKSRFTRERSKIEGAIGTIKNTLGLKRLRAKGKFGEKVKIMKAAIGYNFRYAF